MSTRREFLLNCSAFAAAAALAPAPALAGTSRLGPREVGLDHITAEAFAEQVHTRFVVQDPQGRAVSLLLAAVEPVDSDADAAPDEPPPRNTGWQPAGSRTGTESQERFSLFFAGDDAPPLGQNTYSFEHARLGRFEMFIVPVGRPVSGCRVYEAVFDRPTPSARGHKHDASGNPMR